MATFLEFELTDTDGTLAEVFDRLPSSYCYVERTAASDDFGLWFSGVDRSSLEAALDEDPSVTEYALIREADDEFLYEIRFTADVYEIGSLLFADGGTILAASAERATWRIRMRFPDHGTATRTYRRLLERDLAVEVVRLRERPTADADRLGLTAEQYEALVTAIERGYYEVPREVSLQELADEFGISAQSVSERLRRAASRILSTELDGARTRSGFDDH